MEQTPSRRFDPAVVLLILYDGLDAARRASFAADCHPLSVRCPALAIKRHVEDGCPRENACASALR